MIFIRYEIDENNYISAVYFNCYGSACAEYTGTIPDGYTSLEDWASNATIQAYKIVDSNLVYDSVRDEQLQAQWEEELQNNTPKEYELPTASATTLGGVKVGAGLAINEGVLSATGGGTADSIDWSNVQNKPTKVSQFTNDADYQTASQVEATVTGKGYQTASDVNTIVNNEINAKIPTALDFYPVGSIYMSVNNVNPNSLFGGTWEVWGSGRVPVGVDASQTEFNTVEKTGGEKTRRLVSDNLPSKINIDYGKSGSRNVGAIDGSVIYTASTKSGSVAMDLGGKDESFKILQPYITCYMWKRTA